MQSQRPSLHCWLREQMCMPGRVSCTSALQVQGTTWILQSCQHPRHTCANNGTLFLSPFRVESDQATPLHYAATNPSADAAVAALLALTSAGAKVGAKTSNGGEPLVNRERSCNLHWLERSAMMLCGSVAGHSKLPSPAHHTSNAARL